MAKALLTNGLFEITHIKIKHTNARMPKGCTRVLRVREGKALKLLKMVREDFMIKSYI